MGATYSSEGAYAQAAAAVEIPADVPIQSLDQMVEHVRKEEFLTAVEPGTVANIELANMVFEIPAVEVIQTDDEPSPIHTPTLVAEEFQEEDSQESEMREGKSICAESAPYEPEPSIPSEGERGAHILLKWHGHRRCSNRIP